MRPLACAALLALVAPAVHAQPAAVPRPQVVVLGTFHFDNPGLDRFNPQVDDVLQPHRQAEIDAMVRTLAGFRPTRVALEYPPAHDSAWNARYAAYLRGEHALGRDEREQVGFRVARQLGHPRVYGVDHPGSMDLGGVFAFAAQNGQGALVEEAQARMGAAMAAFAARQPVTPLHALIRQENSAAADSLHGLYLAAATIGRDTAYPGADMVAAWYARNLKMYANLVRVAERPDDRVLLVVGSGHGTLLRQFVRESPMLELAPLEPYLPPAP